MRKYLNLFLLNLFFLEQKMRIHLILNKNHPSLAQGPLGKIGRNPLPPPSPGRNPTPHTHTLFFAEIKSEIGNGIFFFFFPEE